LSKKHEGIAHRVPDLFAFEPSPFSSSSSSSSLRCLFADLFLPDASDASDILRFRPPRGFGGDAMLDFECDRVRGIMTMVVSDKARVTL
jgi:hypothetical protein